MNDPRVAIASATATGLLLAFAAPPFDLWPLALVGLVPVYVVVRERPPVIALALGAVSGLVLHTIAQLWWIGLLHRFTDLSISTAVGLAGIAIAWSAAEIAVWAGLSRAIVARSRLPWVFVSPLVLVLIEVWWPSFFELHLGVVLWRAWPLVQISEICGATATSALLVLVNVVVAEIAMALRVRQAPSRSVWIAGAIALLVAAGGFLRGREIDSRRANAPTLDIGILQPNFGLMTLAERGRQGRHLVDSLRRATRQLASEGAELIVWPESAWPLLWDRRRDRELPKGHPWSVHDREPSALLIGALTHPFGSSELYNSALLLRPTGEIAGTYDRVRLVPFSEYVPFGDRHPDWKKAVQEAVPDRPEITPGLRAVVLEDGKARLGILICSEDLDTRSALAATSLGANLIVSMANDGWFDGSAAVHQHLALATFRAIETRRDLVRVTTNGISAHVDAVGRIRMEGPSVTVEPGERTQPTLLRAEVSLLENRPLGETTIRYFPLACALLLGLSYALDKGLARERRPRRKRARPVAPRR